MDNDEYYMKLALENSKTAFLKNEVPVGAIIVYADKVIASSFNQKETDDNIISHAEILAILEASKKIGDWRLEDCTMYVTLFPCPMCASAIIQSRINKLVIGADTNDLNNKKIVEMIFKESLNKRNLQIKEHVLENECSTILKQFFQKQRKDKQ